MENANGGMTLTGRGDPAQLPRGRYLEISSTSGVRAAMGRPLTARDDDVASAPVVVLSDGCGAQRFGAIRPLSARP
jgi:hypothetical protein